ncbi:MAG: hypothetical protein ACR2NZ_24140, partial [Rubripirellula sp.]
MWRVEQLDSLQLRQGQPAWNRSLTGHVIEGYTFGDFRGLQPGDEIEFPLRWESKDNSELVGKVVRLELRLRHARLYA